MRCSIAASRLQTWSTRSLNSRQPASNDVLESDETDNAGYAYVEIRGSTVRVLERGRGQSPWDPRKVLADDILPSNA